MNGLQFIIATLAVWRLTHLLVAEDGPFKVIAWLRRKAASGFWGTLLDCFYCLSFWIAIPFAVFMGGSHGERILLWPALSAAAILLNRVVDRVAPDVTAYFEQPDKTDKEES